MLAGVDEEFLLYSPRFSSQKSFVTLAVRISLSPAASPAFRRFLWSLFAREASRRTIALGFESHSGEVEGCREPMRALLDINPDDLRGPGALSIDRGMIGAEPDLYRRMTNDRNQRKSLRAAF